MIVKLRKKLIIPTNKGEGMKRTLMSLLAKRVHDTPDLVYLKFRKNHEAWETMTWREYGDRIDRMSRALIGAGIKAGSKVSIIGPASPKWFIIDMSVMTIGATIAPIYFSSSSDQIVYIINHSEAEILFVHEAGYLEKIEHRIISMPSLKKVIVMNGNNPGSLPKTLDLASFECLGDSVPDPLLEDMRDRVNEDDIATYIYTSGTTGPPKAVMLSQKNYYAAGQAKLT